MTAPSALSASSGAVSDAVARAEAQLAAFWSAPEGSVGPSAVKVRASTLNYVVLCAPQDAAAYREAAEKLSETHGGRTLLLTMSGRIAAWELVPEIHAVCRIDGSVPVCYDRVDLTFGAVAASRAASVVRSLALPELATVVEVGAFAPTPLIETVAGKFGRLIVDSAKTSARAIAKMLQGSASPVADRAMVRTYAWRELVARFFDGEPQALAEIRHVEVERTTISQTSGGTSQEPATLIFGWLASRLGWTFVSRREARTRDGHAVELVVSDNNNNTNVGAGQLTAIRIRTSIAGQSLDCSLERSSSAAAARWKMRGAKNADREHALGFKDETWVTVRAIDGTDGDVVTRETLVSAAAWEGCT